MARARAYDEIKPIRRGDPKPNEKLAPIAFDKIDRPRMRLERLGEIGGKKAAKTMATPTPPRPSPSIEVADKRPGRPIIQIADEVPRPAVVNATAVKAEAIQLVSNDVGYANQVIDTATEDVVRERNILGTIIGIFAWIFGLFIFLRLMKSLRKSTQIKGKWTSW